MKSFIIICTFVLIVCAIKVPKKFLTDIEFIDLFNGWKVEHGKSQTGYEHDLRSKIFAENYKKAVLHNNVEGIAYTQGINQFSDLTSEEFLSKFTMKNKVKITSSIENKSNVRKTSDVPTSVDWCSNKKVSTPVKNQMQCGSCWAFSAIEALESREVLIQKNPLKILSEQELVSCDKVDQGCNGGLPSNAYTWLAKKGAILESDQPYKSGGGSTGTCKEVLPTRAFTNIAGYKDIEHNSDAALEAAVAVGPVSIGVDAASDWQSQTGGIISNGWFFGCGSSTLDHGVVVCGYGQDESGKKFWKVRNSWASTWGEEGFIRLKRGNNANTCGILSMPVIPTFD